MQVQLQRFGRFIRALREEREVGKLALVVAAATFLGIVSLSFLGSVLSFIGYTLAVGLRDASLILSDSLAGILYLSSLAGMYLGATFGALTAIIVKLEHRSVDVSAVSPKRRQPWILLFVNFGVIVIAMAYVQASRRLHVSQNPRVVIAAATEGRVQLATAKTAGRTLIRELTATEVQARLAREEVGRLLERLERQQIAVNQSNVTAREIESKNLAINKQIEDVRRALGGGNNHCQNPILIKPSARDGCRALSQV